MSGPLCVLIEASGESAALERTRRSVDAALHRASGSRVAVVEAITAQGLAAAADCAVVAPLRAGELVGETWFAGALVIAAGGDAVARPETHLRYGGAPGLLHQASLDPIDDRMRALAAPGVLLAPPLAASPAIFARFGWPDLGANPSDMLSAWRWTLTVLGAGVAQRVAPGTLVAVPVRTPPEPLAVGVTASAAEALAAELAADREALRERVAALLASPDRAVEPGRFRRLKSWLNR